MSKEANENDDDVGNSNGNDNKKIRMDEEEVKEKEKENKEEQKQEPFVPVFIFAFGENFFGKGWVTIKPLSSLEMMLLLEMIRWDENNRSVHATELFLALKEKKYDSPRDEECWRARCMVLIDKCKLPCDADGLDALHDNNLATWEPTNYQKCNKYVSAKEAKVYLVQQDV